MLTLTLPAAARAERPRRTHVQAGLGSNAGESSAQTGSTAGQSGSPGTDAPLGGSSGATSGGTAA